MTRVQKALAVLFCSALGGIAPAIANADREHASRPSRGHLSRRMEKGTGYSTRNSGTVS